MSGQEIYLGVCSACHQENGQGLTGQYPPLAKSEWVTGDPETPARIVLRGLRRPITAVGMTADNDMPAHADQLSDEEIAAVLTFVRSSFGNSAPPVTAELVARIRKETESRPQWTAAELYELRTQSSTGSQQKTEERNQK